MTPEEHFIKCYPNEGVGYLKDGQFFPLDNVAENPQHTFEVFPAFIVTKKPDALLHSHTGSHYKGLDPRTPSKLDLQGQINMGIEWGICHTDGERCSEPVFWGNPKHRPPLEGRNFMYGVNDCFTLVQDWYFQNRGVVLPNFARDPFWHDEGENHIEEQYSKWGFHEISMKEAVPGDVFLYAIRSATIRHLSVYLGNNKVLSHFYDRLSCAEDFGTWAKYIVGTVRHVSTDATHH